MIDPQLQLCPICSFHNSGELFASQPQHPGAAHYLIHATDTAAMAPLGLAAARSYAKIAPSSPHALHMPAHIFVRDDENARRVVVRYRHGLRDSPAPGAEGDVFTARISSPGPLFGVQVRLTPNASRDGLGFDWIPQVCFEEEETTKRRWFTEDRLTPEFLKDVRFGSKVFFAVPTRADWVRLRTKLISLGFKLGGEPKSQQFAPQTTFNTRVRWGFDAGVLFITALIRFRAAGDNRPSFFFALVAVDSTRNARRRAARCRFQPATQLFIWIDPFGSSICECVRSAE